MFLQKSKDLINFGLKIDLIKYKWFFQSVTAIVYSLIVFPNHFLFRTFALDLGLYTNALYHYRNFELATTQMIHNQPILALSDHFDLYLILFSPLSFIFGNITLLVIQIAAVILGGEGAYRLIIKLTGNHKIALVAMLHFYSFFGVITALGFDYHSNLISMMLVPWLILALENNRIKSFVILLVAVWIGKENISIIVGFFLLSYVFYLKNSAAKKALLFGVGASFIYFFCITFYVMPVISGMEKYGHFEYVLGASPLEMILEILRHPINAIQLTFGEHLEGVEIVKIKLELMGLLFLSGILFLFKRPFLIIGLVPIVLMKFLHENAFMVGVGAQYSIEFLPLLLVGVFPVVAEFGKKTINVLISVILLGSVVSIKRIMEEPLAPLFRTNIKVFEKEHYENKAFAVNELNEILDLIPSSGSVSAQSAIVPHLAMRDSIFLFPTERGANYILLNVNDNTYPLNGDQLRSHIEDLKLNEEWKLISSGQNGIFLFEKAKH